MIHVYYFLATTYRCTIVTGSVRYSHIVSKVSSAEQRGNWKYAYYELIVDLLYVVTITFLPFILMQKPVSPVFKQEDQAQQQKQ